MNHTKVTPNQKEKWAPFEHPPPSPISILHIFLLVFGIFLIPIRLAFTITLFPLSAIIGLISVFGIDLTDEKPLPKLRATFFHYSLQFICKLGLFVLGFVPKVTGKYDSKVKTIVTNHTSYLDILVILSTVGASFVAKDSVRNIPIIGNLSKALQSVYTAHARGLQSSNTKGSADRIVERQHKLQDKRENFPPLLIFPEGTTTNGKFLIRFRKGAFIGGFPVQPVVIKYGYRMFSATWETIPPHVSILQLLIEPWRSCEVIILPPIYPTSEERSNPQLFADHVQKKMAEVMEVPATNQTIQDKLEYHSMILSGKLKWNIPISNYL